MSLAVQTEEVVRGLGHDPDPVPVFPRVRAPAVLDLLLIMVRLLETIILVPGVGPPLEDFIKTHSHVKGKQTQFSFPVISLHILILACSFSELVNSIYVTKKTHTLAQRFGNIK